MDIQIPPLKAFKKLDKEMRELIIGEIQKDKELQKLQEKLNGAIREQRYWQDMINIAVRNGSMDDRIRAEKSKKKSDKLVAQVEEQIKNRSDFFVEIWMRKYSKTVLTVQGGLELIDDPDDKAAYLWRMCLSWFLADFLEDVLMELEATIRKYYPEEKLGQLQEFFALKRIVQRYMKEALKGETDEAVAFFDNKSHSIKTTMWNIAKAYYSAETKEEAKGQLELWEEETHPLPLPEGRGVDSGTSGGTRMKTKTKTKTKTLTKTKT